MTDFAKYPLWTTGLKEIVDQTATGDGKPRWEFKVRNPNPNPSLTLRGNPNSNPNPNPDQAGTMGLTISYTLEYTIDGETSLSWKSVSQA